MNFLIIATASWTEGYEHPSGGRDVHKRKSANLHREFTASNLREGRKEAQRLLTKFKARLPKKCSGSLSWNDAPKITSVKFARLLDSKSIQ